MGGRLPRVVAHKMFDVCRVEMRRASERQGANTERESEKLLPPPPARLFLVAGTDESHTHVHMYSLEEAEYTLHPIQTDCRTAEAKKSSTSRQREG